MYDKYKEFAKNTNPNDYKIVEYSYEIKEIFNKAGIKKDLQVPFDNVNARGKINPLLNINNTMPEIVMFYNLRFTEALGCFRNNIYNTINPFYWIDFFIYFPQKVLNYLNVINSIFTNIVNIIYWAYFINWFLKSFLLK